ncbi:MAG: hypothetical protein K0S80_5168 [Neobacillus sp.]|nr:hypothetical protein [Neobacillus sp.]
MYRPTVRYDDVYKTYVDDLFHSTHLDRNQIIRAALFAAAHSKEFLDVIQSHKKGGVPTPSPPWMLHQHGYWMEQCPNLKVEEGDVDAISGGTEDKINPGIVERREERRLESVPGRERAIPIRTAGGGITIRIS